MSKRILASVGAFFGATALAVAANLSLVTGPQDPSQLNATINGVINNINSSVSRIGVASTAVADAATTAEQTLLQYSLPGGLLANPGDSVRISCWGITGADTFPNVTIEFVTADFTSLTATDAGTEYTIHLYARRNSDSKDSVFPGTITFTLKTAPA